MPHKTKRHASIEPTRPGAFIAEECIAPLGLSKVAVAKALGISRNTLYLLLDGKIAISAEMAVRLQAVFGPSAESWLNMQMGYDLWHARRAVDTRKLTRLWPVETA